jgi:tagatose-1,6-bisphosphate aldolase
MKKKLLAAAFALISAQAMAMPHWMRFTKVSNMTWYLDASSIKKSGADGVAMWAKYDLDAADPQNRNAKTFVFHLNYRCGAPVVGIDSAVVYDDADQIVATSEKMASVTAPPGSIYDDIMDTGCKAMYQSK